MAATHSAAEHPPKPNDSTWWQLLGLLRLPTAAVTSENVVSIVNDALAALAVDAQWLNSGVPEILKRARGLAQIGSDGAARRAALSALALRESDLHWQAHGEAIVRLYSPQRLMFHCVVGPRPSAER
jgi:hypothetical protein